MSREVEEAGPEETGSSATLGDELRRRREEADIDLREIAEATCIGVRFLRAIDENDFKTLPGGLFTRSFIRSYARYVGMDENEAIRLYIQQSGEGETEAHELISESARAKAGSSMWANLIIALAVIGVLTLGGFAGWNYWQRTQSVKQAVATPGPRSTIGDYKEPTAEAATSLPKPVSEPPPVAPESQMMANRMKPESAAGQIGETPDEVMKTEFPETVPRSEPTLPPPNSLLVPPARTETIPRPVQLEMSVRATGDCSIYVQADSHSPWRENLREGDRRIFTAEEKLVISAQNAPNLNITINGRTVQLPQSGTVIGGVIITPQNLERFIKE